MTSTYVRDEPKDRSGISVSFAQCFGFGNRDHQEGVEVG